MNAIFDINKISGYRNFTVFCKPILFYGVSAHCFVPEFGPLTFMSLLFMSLLTVQLSIYLSI